jgi:hypothetical protein
MGKGQRYGLIAGILGAFIGGGAIYASPYLTLYQMYQSVKQKDAQGVASYVNFPALRESVKTNVQGLVSQELSKQDNPLMALIGSAVSGFVVDPVIDQIVTPEGVAALLEGQQLLLNRDRQPQLSEKATEVEVQPHYESFNQFVVSVKPKGETAMPVDLLLSREGLGWKVTGVRLPQPQMLQLPNLPQLPNFPQLPLLSNERISIP